MASLRAALMGIGEPLASPLAMRGGFMGRAPRSLRLAMEGMADPGVASWAERGVALKSTNTKQSEEAQGAATDGAFWYVCSNNTKRVVQFDDAGNRTMTYRALTHIGHRVTKSTHFGAPGYHDGRLYVPTQGPRGVWRFHTDDSHHEWLAASALPDGDLFAWCAVHPVTGLLYTCNYDRPRFLRAYTRDRLDYRPEHDISIGPLPLDLDRVQGGVFTTRGRIILVRCSFNAVFCLSSLNGHCFGAKQIGNFGSTRSEVESVAVRWWQFGDVVAPVHILELDNDWSSKDDVYLHSFAVPDPVQL